MMESEINRLVALCEGLTQILYLFDNSRADSDCVYNVPLLLLAEVGGGGVYGVAVLPIDTPSHRITIRMALYCRHLFCDSSTCFESVSGCSARTNHLAFNGMHSAFARMPYRSPSSKSCGAKRTSYGFGGFSMANCDT